MCVIIHLYVWHMTHSYVWHDCVTWLVHMCYMTHSHVWHDSFICVTWLIHICDMTHSYVCHDTFICVPWLIHIAHMNHSYLAWDGDALDIPHDSESCGHVAHMNKSICRTHQSVRSHVSISQIARIKTCVAHMNHSYLTTEGDALDIPHDSESCPLYTHGDALDIQPITDGVAQHLEIFSTNFRFSTRRTRILMGLIIYYLVLIVNSMGRILVCWKSFQKNLEIQCHPIRNRLYLTWDGDTLDLLHDFESCPLDIHLLHDSQSYPLDTHGDPLDISRMRWGRPRHSTWLAVIHFSHSPVIWLQHPRQSHCSLTRSHMPSKNTCDMTQTS